MSEQQWSTVIRPTAGLFDLRLYELWRYRDLILLLIKRDFVAQYKQTILGPLWFIIQPLLTTITFTILFGTVAKLSTDGAPKLLFYMTGTIAWSYFASCLTKISGTFITNANLFGKVYFPRLVLPIVNLTTNAFSLGLQVLILIGFMSYYAMIGWSFTFTASLWLVPVLFLMMGLFGLGLGIIISALTTKYKDLQQVVGFGVNLFMYATPVIYPLSTIPEHLRIWMLLNPLTAIIEALRHAVLNSGSFDPLALIVSMFSIIIVMFVGILMFSRIERTFMDTI